jgi:hypothetical protein
MINKLPIDTNFEVLVKNIIEEHSPIDKEVLIKLVINMLNRVIWDLISQGHCAVSVDWKLIKRNSQ